MIRARYALGLLTVASAMTISGCAGTGQQVQTAYGAMPDYCLYNNTAQGAAIGTLLGAGLGGALGGGRGAAIGAVSGLALGSAAGAQRDAECRQLALQRTMEMVLAQQQQQQAAAAAAAAANQPPPPAQVVSYRSVEYATPSNKRRNRITPTNSFTDPATRTTCATFTEVSFDDNDKPAQTRSGKVCKKADGSVSES